MQSDPNNFFRLARQESVVKRAAKIALIVGTILAAINHGDAIVSGTLTFVGLLKIIATFCVPYGVSTVSAVLALRDQP